MRPPLSTSGEGLSSTQAAALLAEVGPNTIPERRPGVLTRLAGKLWAPVPWMLEATIVLEVALGKWLDAAVVAAVLVGNTAVGFVQEGRAAAAVALLRRRLAVNARVRRDGTWTLLPAADLVPGDLVHVRAGDLVPADLRVDDGGVLVDQSTLTGESFPAERGQGESLYSAGPGVLSPHRVHVGPCPEPIGKQGAYPSPPTFCGSRGAPMALGRQRRYEHVRN